MTILNIPNDFRRLLVSAPTFYKRLNESVFIQFRIGMILFYFCCFIIQCEVKDRSILVHTLQLPDPDTTPVWDVDRSFIEEEISVLPNMTTTDEFAVQYNNSNLETARDKVYLFRNNETNQTTFSYDSRTMFYNGSGDYYFQIDEITSGENNTLELAVNVIEYIFKQDDYQYLNHITGYCFAASFICLCLSVFGVLTTRTLRVGMNNVFQGLCHAAAGVLIIVCVVVRAPVFRFWHIFYIFLIIPAGFEIILIFVSYWKGLDRY